MPSEEPSRKELLSEVQRLRRELERLESENADLEIQLETALEHGDVIESMLFERNQEIDCLYRHLELAHQELKSLVHLDGLTGIANRRRFTEYFSIEWQRSLREQTFISLILCDLDFFKRFNDTYGHLAGDECLRLVAQTLNLTVKRPADLVARYGGEEFAAILPHTPSTGAMQVAEAFRKSVRALMLIHAGSPISRYVTLSLGVASTLPKTGMKPETLLGAADKALYQAKQTGRDRSVLYAPTPLVAIHMPHC